MKKILGMLIGTILLGMGITLNRLSLLGNDTLSAFVFSLVEMTNLSYTLIYILFNMILFIPMIIFMKNKIYFGTIVNVILTGIIVDLLMMFCVNLNITIESMFLKIIIGTLGVLFSTFGLALYLQADFGIVPFDASVILFSKKVKLNYGISRIIVDIILLTSAFVISNIILKNHAVGLFTIISCFVYGPLIKAFSYLINHYLLKVENPNIK